MVSKHQVLIERLREGATRVAKRCMGDAQQKVLISIPVNPEDIDVIMADAADALEALKPTDGG